MAAKRLDPHHSAVLLIDMQERLLPVMQHGSTVIRRTTRLIEGANVLRIPVAVTEQYPRGLGKTVAAIATKLHGAVYTDPKTRFSACGPSLMRLLDKLETQSLIVAGLETHVCVLQTCLDLLDRGYTVALCLDAISSRREIDRQAAVDRLVQAGVVPTTVEAVLFELLADVDSPAFKELRSVIQSPDS